MPRNMETPFYDADNVLTVRTDCHMLGAKTSPENPNSSLFPNISGLTASLSLSLSLPLSMYIHVYTTYLYIYVYI